MPYKNFKPCTICGKQVVGKGFCEKHYRRFKSTGNALHTKHPDDWGTHTNHPLNQSWKWTTRVKEGRNSSWDDFKTFLQDVGDRPENHKLRRKDTAEPWGPDNFYWREIEGEAQGRKNAYAKEWRAKNPLKAKSAGLKSRYGITIEEYNEMLLEQGGGCAICEKPETNQYSLAVDHNHENGKVRALLCSQCNRSLGGFKDDRKLLMKAVMYLDSHA